MKNLAGNEVAIFMYRFVFKKNGIQFVLNESLAEDMYPDIEARIEPLVQACGDTLLRYRDLCQGDIIMDGNILVEGEFEVILSSGLGKYFNEKEKNNLFDDACAIAQLLTELMDRRADEAEKDIVSEAHTVVPKIQRTQSTNEGLEALANQREFLDNVSTSNIEGADYSRLRVGDLPQGVIVRKGYDHRGYCYAYEHDTLGDIGKIILIEQDGGFHLVAEVCSQPSGTLLKKRKVLEEIYVSMQQGLQNFVKTL